MTVGGLESAPFIETVDLIPEKTLQTIEQGGDAGQQLNMDFCGRLVIAMERGAQQALSELRRVNPANVIVVKKQEDVSANNTRMQVLVTPDVVMSRCFDSSAIMDCHVAFGRTITSFLRAVRTMHELIDRRRIYVVPAKFEWSCDGSAADGIEPYSRTIVFSEGNRLVLESDFDGGSSASL